MQSKRKKNSCSFIIDPLKYVINSFISKTKIKRFGECVVCFRNVYINNGKVIKDHDNIETKQVLDVVTEYFLVDDTGVLCSNFYTTAIGESERTEVYVIPKANFEKWIKFYSI